MNCGVTNARRLLIPRSFLNNSERNGAIFGKRGVAIAAAL